MNSLNISGGLSKLRNYPEVRMHQKQHKYCSMVQCMASKEKLMSQSLRIPSRTFLKLNHRLVLPEQKWSSKQWMANKFCICIRAASVVDSTSNSAMVTQVTLKSITMVLEVSRWIRNIYGPKLIKPADVRSPELEVFNISRS